MLGRCWEALGPSELYLQVPAVCWAWLCWETGPLSGLCSQRLLPVGPAEARAHGQTFVNSLALWRFWGRGLSRGDQVGGAKIRSGLSSQRGVSAQITSCWKLGMSCLSAHCLDRPQMCWWLLLWAWREARQQDGRIPALALVGLGFHQ